MPFYKIDSIFVELYRSTKQSKDEFLNSRKDFFLRDSIMINLYFKIHYCDSSGKKNSDKWLPSRGSKGLLKKIKKIKCILINKDNSTQVPLSDFRLVTESVDYSIKVDSSNSLVRTNSLNRAGCKLPIDSLIKKINEKESCFLNNGLRNTFFLYHISKSKMIVGENILEFEVELEDYTISKRIILILR